MNKYKFYIPKNPIVINKEHQKYYDNLNKKVSSKPFYYKYERENLFSLHGHHKQYKKVNKRQKFYRNKLSSKKVNLIIVLKRCFRFYFYFLDKYTTFYKCIYNNNIYTKLDKTRLRFYENIKSLKTLNFLLSNNILSSFNNLIFLKKIFLKMLLLKKYKKKVKFKQFLTSLKSFNNNNLLKSLYKSPVRILKILYTWLFLYKNKLFDTNIKYFKQHNNISIHLKYSKYGDKVFKFYLNNNNDDIKIKYIKIFI